MASKITQFQIDPGQLTSCSISVAADWVFDPASPMYQRYRNLNREDFIETMKKFDDEGLLTKPLVTPIGAALVDKGSTSCLVLLALYEGKIIPAEDIFGYMGVDLKRSEVIDIIMDMLRNGK